MSSSSLPTTRYPHSTQLAISAVLIAALVVAKIIPHPWNFSAVGALCLLSGSLLRDKRYAAVVPVLAMLLGDVYLDITRYQTAYSLTNPAIFAVMSSVWICYALYGQLGTWIARMNRNWVSIGASCLAGSLFFFVVTNFADFLFFRPHTWTDLGRCYLDAIPYYRNSLLSDLTFATLLFGGWAAIDALEPTTEKHRV